MTELEGRSTGERESLDHLSDEELETMVLDLILQFQAAGVLLPDDWRARYDRSSIRFLEWLEREAKELAECAG